MIEEVKKYQCVYCLLCKDETEFDEEHIVQAQLVGESLGTLKFAICKECNRNFGKTIDGQLNKNSIEGLFAAKIGVSQYKNILKPQDLEIRLVEDSNGPIFLPKGTYLIFDCEIKKFFPKKQLIFKKKDSEESVFITSDQFKTSQELREILVENKANFEKDFDIIGYSQAESLRLEKFLKSISPQVEVHPLCQEGTEEYKSIGQQVLMTTNIKINQQVLRAICKIALNFSVHCFGEDFRKVLFNSTFNPIREFIKYGKGDSRNFIIPDTDPIFVGETQQYRKGAPYQCSFLLSWHRNQFGTHDLKAVVNLFHLFSYHVTLARNYRQNTFMYTPPQPFVNKQIRIGKSFDPQTKEEVGISATGIGSFAGLKFPLLEYNI